MALALCAKSRPRGPLNAQRLEEGHAWLTIMRIYPSEPLK